VVIHAPERSFDTASGSLSPYVLARDRNLPHQPTDYRGSCSRGQRLLSLSISSNSSGFVATTLVLS